MVNTVLCTYLPPTTLYTIHTIPDSTVKASKNFIEAKIEPENSYKTLLKWAASAYSKVSTSILTTSATIENNVY